MIVADGWRNAPFHPTQPNKLWPVESVYALIEVKTYLSLTELSDAVAKCRRFKTLDRDFLQTSEPQHMMSSLFVIWGYDSAAPETLKENLLEAIANVPSAEQPDLVVVPDRLVARCGEYLELARLGQSGSDHRRALYEKYGQDLSILLPAPAEVDDYGENSLLAWFVWFDSWLRRAGPRLFDPIRYIPPDGYCGRQV